MYFQDDTSRQISQPLTIELARGFIKVQAIVKLTGCGYEDFLAGLSI